MKPDQQQFQIATALGWRLKNGMWHHPDGAPMGFTPDYLGNLDAIQKAVLTLKDKAAFTFHLLEILGIRDDQSPEPSEMFDFANATAAQRAKAFLKTIGKWQE